MQYTRQLNVELFYPQLLGAPYIGFLVCTIYMLWVSRMYVTVRWHVSLTLALIFLIQLAFSRSDFFVKEPGFLYCALADDYS